ncbi:hypothetical protein FJ417_24685 [Mesorhizobium sp. B3-1-7]|uniref:hypothetical protein n=1 Tax=Mesorhizobium sp. B3-1-7 TaxID=2589894 RepID=UPI00112B1F63|nr:hypothetical protein [Mesorhizobium sp. B3-1-7]TPI54750.1 hypothetical protein FJ417_24685 [Mesorhizobium sp. B3-1-7]
MTADLTPPEHEHSAAIDLAVEWLSQNPRDRIGQPIVPLLRERFGLSAVEACEVCREANLRMARAA